MNPIIVVVIIIAIGIVCLGGFYFGYQYGYGKNQEADARVIVHEMKDNSADWNTSDQMGRVQLSAKNTALGAILPQFGVNAIYEPKTGIWYIDNVGGEKLYDKY